jgi:hypothetical protein
MRADWCPDSPPPQVRRPPARRSHLEMAPIWGPELASDSERPADQHYYSDNGPLCDFWTCCDKAHFVPLCLFVGTKLLVLTSFKPNKPEEIGC